MCLGLDSEGDLKALVSVVCVMTAAYSCEIALNKETEVLVLILTRYVLQGVFGKWVDYLFSCLNVHLILFFSTFCLQSFCRGRTDCPWGK